jgi:hypothetical protein
VFEDPDELARGLAENEISRGRAIRRVGYGVVGAALSSMGFAGRAEALTPAAGAVGASGARAWSAAT